MKYMFKGITSLTFIVLFSSQVIAQEAIVEEIVVTGSYIKRDKFEMASPVETIDPETILSSGQTTIGGLVRSLPYTQNVDTVANVLAAGGGQQDSNGARFNLRGLGSNSTLTLMDGRRAIDPEAIATILPELAMGNIDIVLDGGAATYGTDAVAGVVNFVPLQSYDGFKIRAFYSQDEEGDVPEPKINLLWGKSWNKLDVVAALDYSERKDPLYRSDRPKYNKADANVSTSGNPGTFRTYVAGAPVGTFVGADPGCGSNNGTATDDAYAGVYPTGFNYPAAFACYFDYGEFQDYKRPNENLVVYTSATYQMNDDVALKAIINYSDRTSTLISTGSTFNTGSNSYLQIPASHPNNPYGFAVEPSSWRPFIGNRGTTEPSIFDDHGAFTPEYEYTTYQVALGSEFDIGDTGWSGETWATVGNRERDVSGGQIISDRLQLALLGMGGTSGTEWFNPFATASSYSLPQGASLGYGDCAAGTGTDPSNGRPCSANSQSVVDWIYEAGKQNIESRDYWSIEGFVSGEIFELPAGPVSMAVGAQVRETEEATRPTYQDSTVPSALFTTPSGAPVGRAYNVDPSSGVLDPKGDGGINGVNSIFVEFILPLLDNLELNLAARYESFTDFGLTTTVPKISLRWTPIEQLALRASWGEGFLAPTIYQATVRSSVTCGEAFAGTDGFGNSYIGADICSNGSATLDPEESTIFNIGASWNATENLEFSIDYQTIDYTDRISLSTSGEVVSRDKAAFDAAGLVASSAADRASWYANGQDPRIVRGNFVTIGDDETITRITSTYDNTDNMNVELIDFRTRYSMDLGDWGYLSAKLTSTFYLTYEIDQPDGSTYSAVNHRNEPVSLAPPIPHYKNSLSAGWLKDSHSLAITVNNHGGVDMDYGALDGPFAFGPPGDRSSTATRPKRLNAYTTIDMRYGYTFDDLWGGSLDLGIGSNNVTGNDPQALPVLGGLETRTQDPVGRTFYVEGTYSFE